MGVIVNNHAACNLALGLASPVNTREFSQGCGDFLKWYSEFQAHCHCGQGVFDIVLAGDLQAQLAKFFAQIADHRFGSFLDVSNFRYLKVCRGAFPVG